MDFTIQGQERISIQVGKDIKRVTASIPSSREFAAELSVALLSLAVSGLGAALSTNADEE